MCREIIFWNNEIACVMFVCRCGINAKARHARATHAARSAAPTLVTTNTVSVYTILFSKGQ